MQLNGFKPGANITILNTYYKRFKDENNRMGEVLAIIFRDLDNNIKYKEEIIDPEVTYYVAKPDKRTSYNRLFISKDDVEERVAVKRKIDRASAKDVGLGTWYSDCINAGDREQAKLIQMHPDLFGTDVNIEDHYRFKFDNTYKNEVYDPTKAYFDIEVDSISMSGDFPQPGECPVNAITIVLPHVGNVFTLLLKTKSNPQIEEFEQFIKEDMGHDLIEFIRNHVNKENPNLFEKYNLNKLKFNIGFYDEENEIGLIADLFKIINVYQPDFVLAWNMAFDIPYLISRIAVLGYNPTDIMCHPHFEYKFAEYYVDERNKNEFAERGDFAIISSYSVYMDQMIQYASRRKGQTRPLSYGLDFIGYLVAKVHKLDYKDITTSISELPYKNFKKFVYYNIMDTIVQYCIEQVCGDIDYTFSKSIVNNTRYSKVHRQTVYLANRGRKEFYNDGFIMGNNFNKFNEPPATKFPGAFVANPSKISNKLRVKINGIPIDVFRNNDDFDYASLYPNLIIQFNIAMNTQIGMVIIPDKIHDQENRRHLEHWNRSGAFFEDYHTHNWIMVGKRWFNLFGIEDLCKHVEWYFNNILTPTCMYGFIEGERKYWQPIKFYEGGWAPIMFEPPMNTNRIEEYLRYVEANPNQRF